MILRCTRILGTELGDVADGWVRTEGDRIADVGRGEAPVDAGEVLTLDGWLAPGYVDIHVHGGGGGSFQTGDPEDAAAVAAFHRQHGTTTMLASLVSADLDELVEVTRRLAPLVEAGDLAGIHLEGPFLSATRRGAHDPGVLRDPDAASVARLLDAGPVRVVTLAPELPAALEAIAQITARGAVAAIGHTDASYEQTLAAIEAGARLGTHLFNGMRPIHHREPGPVPALLADPRAVVELIGDGVHVHSGLVASLLGALDGRVALVTDAIGPTGLPDGCYHLGTQEILVRGGVPVLAEGDSLAGSTLTMGEAVARAVRSGVAPSVAVAAATATPARVLGLQDEIGQIAPGLRADLVELDGTFGVVGTWRGGERSK